MTPDEAVKFVTGLVADNHLLRSIVRDLRDGIIGGWTTKAAELDSVHRASRVLC